MSISLVENSFPGRDIGFSRIDEPCPLEYFPECVQRKEDGDPDIRRQEIGGIEFIKDPEAVEDDDHGKVAKRHPSSIRLPRRFEDQSVPVNTLCFESFMELDVSNADGTPSEKRGNCREVLEPCEHRSGTAFPYAKVSEQRDRGSDGNAKVRDAPWNR